MRLFYGGPAQARVIGEARWTAANRWTVDVPAATAAEALCQPGERFEVALDEPLRTLRGMTDDALFELAMAGIGSVEELAAATPDQVKKLSATLPKVRAWQRDAAGNLNPMEE